MQTSELSFYNSRPFKVTLCLVVSVFFYVFLVFFLPFGVDNYNPAHQYTLSFLLEIFYFFITTLLALLLNEFLLRPLILKKVTLKSIIAWSLWTFLLLSSLIFLTYNLLGNWHDYSLKSYLGFLVNCTSVLVFPVVGTFFFFRYRSLQRRMDHILTSKEDLGSSDQLITFTGQGSKDQISLSSAIFLYGKAQDNYVELYYLEQEKLSKFLLRTSLSKLIASIDHPAIIRCHRSYMVNLLRVQAIKGGRNDIQLYLDAFDTAIPVSKSHREAVIQELRTLKQFD